MTAMEKSGHPGMIRSYSDCQIRCGLLHLALLTPSDFVVHQNRGKSPVNKISDDVKRAVQALIKEKYFDVNLAHLQELLGDNEKIHVKRETLRSWAHEIHHVKRARRRRSQARKRRERMESPGLLLQMDGSPEAAVA